eukprot:TRINITY_DN19321_c0_g1_i1.p1 TRINITY_DN19321_c0_g1~~TRINITY_DN19321_c0_g1_i1.p1  ORF type:complete len:200 (-),score=24.75 TRINITY_DN19321_c0_g1_i1:340-939(-)
MMFIRSLLVPARVCVALLFACNATVEYRIREDKALQKLSLNCSEMAYVYFDYGGKNFLRHDFSASGGTGILDWTRSGDNDDNKLVLVPYKGDHEKKYYLVTKGNMLLCLGVTELDVKRDWLQDYYPLHFVSHWTDISNDADRHLCLMFQKDVEEQEHKYYTSLFNTTYWLGSFNGPENAVLDKVKSKGEDIQLEYLSDC